MTTVAVDRNPRRRFRFVSRRNALFVALLGLAAVVISGGYQFLTSISSDQVMAGRAGSYPTQTATYIAEGHFYLVHFDGDQFIALFERSPWLQKVYGSRPDQCRIRWYFGSYTGYADNRPGTGTADPIGDGFFRESCSGWAFDAHGNHLFGASTHLDRFHLHIIDGNVVVDTSTLDANWWLHSPSY
jgi:hypothetical protein